MPNIGICIPTATADVQPETVVEYGRRSEQAGADSVWTIDRLVWNNPEALMSLAAVAGATSRVKLGTCVLLAPLRRPAELAKQVSTLDYVSGGRAILGLGVGSRQDDFDVMDTPLNQRGGRTEEAIGVLRAAWSGEPLKVDGKYYSYDVGPVGPAPINGRIPIWLGGGADAALQRIARVGDGYIGSPGGGMERYKASWAKIVSYAQEIGRDPSTIHNCMLVYACVDPDRERAEKTSLDFLHFYYGPQRSDLSNSLIGPADACVEKAKEFLDAGAETLIIGSYTSDLNQLDRLLNDVVPRLM
ncbi:MAG: LLM class flavin-dependent oxidoreductase [Chloroflexota bacterium]